jgi:hypothetical protein
MTLIWVQEGIKPDQSKFNQILLPKGQSFKYIPTQQLLAVTSIIDYKAPSSSIVSG